MKRAVRGSGWLAFVTFALGTGGCGGGGATAPYRPGVDIEAGAGADAGAPGDALGDGRADGGGDGSNAPLTGPGGRRIVSGPIDFIRNGAPCTNEDGVTGEIWCAILRPSTLQPGSNALYVVNVSQGVAGTAIACGTPTGDPNCLMLTGGIFEDDKHHASFQGRTLVYYDMTGTPYGWRPGMVNGRRLAVLTRDAGDVHDCTAAPRGNAIACLQDVPTPLLPTGGLPGGASTTAQESDLLVGPVGPDSALLPKVETVISSDTADGLQRFQFRFVGPAADRIAWSSRGEPGGPEVLKVQIIGDDASRQVVATDVSRWSVSSDGTRWGWLSAFSYDSQALSGTLQEAPFPAGVGPVTVQEKVASFSFVAAHGMYVLGQDGRLTGVTEPGQAGMAPAIPLDLGVIGVVAVSPAGHLAYVKSYDFVFSLVDLFIQKFDGSGTSCTLDRQEEVPYGSTLRPRFLPSGAALLWARVTNLNTTDDRLIAAGRITRTLDCMTEVIAPDVVALGSLGADGISISDSFDGSSGTLRIRELNASGDLLSSDQAMLVQTRINASVSLYPYLSALLYTVNIGDPADGLYLRPVAPSGASVSAP